MGQRPADWGASNGLAWILGVTYDNFPGQPNAAVLWESDTSFRVAAEWVAS